MDKKITQIFGIGNSRMIILCLGRLTLGQTASGSLRQGVASPVSRWHTQYPYRPAWCPEMLDGLIRWWIGGAASHKEQTPRPMLPF